MRENLVATAAAKPDGWTLDRIHALFPRLAERASSMGNQLSGGEQQMLAIARALMTNPQLLILDEATEGLAPLVRAEIWDCLTRLKQAGQSILVIDKNVEALIRIADHHHLIERGRIVWSGTSQELGRAARAAASLPRRLMFPLPELAGSPVKIFFGGTEHRCLRRIEPRYVGVRAIRARRSIRGWLTLRSTGSGLGAPPYPIA